MTYAYNTFEAWLQVHGFGSYLDNTGELKDGTSQNFVSSKYTAWLTELVDNYADAIRALRLGCRLSAFGFNEPK
jgi:hypothetical protein